ncbi:GMC oxidoreductase domain-containing protein [Ditylenchus destructor]|uniref:GMC oxidoreductase domain-containing protein n=1 Tax=Ditylenchus destructor TaxID=166010 RepID=A0AAD4N6J6_9BILA|nr:GMC oxidoreductase domain-containing protein [Ditylenchus destructor]
MLLLLSKLGKMCRVGVCHKAMVRKITMNSNVGYYGWQNTRNTGGFHRELPEGVKPTHIIVGAGSAGCVLANRLTENPDNRVLLLEAGPKDHWWKWKIHMPAALMYNLCNNRYNWFYHTMAQKNMNDRVIYWPRGRVWGGSSSLNAMVYVRGHPYDYDRWEREGAAGWSYKNVLPYFKKAQTHELSTGPDDPYRGHNGPLHVMQGKCENPLHQAFLKAGEEIGIGYTEDMNGCRQEGLGPMDMTIKDGTRCSSSVAYLKDILDRPNLYTTSGITCTKILFNGKKAVGVEIIKQQKFVWSDDIDSGNKDNVYCEDMVILCGGAINSPQLLMLSGVGPSKHISAFCIPLVQDMPGVGANLQDHLEIYIQQVEHPDIQYHFLPSTVHHDGRVAGSCHAFQLHAGPMRSKSIGKLGLRTVDPRRPPLLDPNYLDKEEDFIEFRKAIRHSREVFAQKAFDEFRGDELAPGKDCVSDEQLDEFIRTNSASAYHPCGTCKMGSSTDSNAVVDPETMSVHGLEGLKVVDASVMPSIVSGNLNAPTIMIAERAADLIMGNRMLSPENPPIWKPER